MIVLAPELLEDGWMEEVFPKRRKHLNAEVLPSNQRSAYTFNGFDSHAGYYKAEHAELVMIDFFKETL